MRFAGFLGAADFCRGQENHKKMSVAQTHNKTQWFCIHFGIGGSPLVVVWPLAVTPISHGWPALSSHPVRHGIWTYLRIAEETQCILTVFAEKL